jgi:hypothetical protein
MNNAALLAVPQPAVSKLGTEGRALHDALKRLELWIEAHNYEAYEPFDGLSSSWRPLTFRIELLERFLQQAVRQSPIKPASAGRVKPLPSTKGRGYMAAGYLKICALTGNTDYRNKAASMLNGLFSTSLQSSKNIPGQIISITRVAVAITQNTSRSSSGHRWSVRHSWMPSKCSVTVVTWTLLTVRVVG